MILANRTTCQLNMMFCHGGNQHRKLGFENFVNTNINQQFMSDHNINKQRNKKLCGPHQNRIPVWYQNIAPVPDFIKVVL